MADEIQLTVQQITENGDYKETLSPGVKKVTQNTQGNFASVVTAASSTYTEVTLGSVSTQGRAYWRNLDATNYVDLYTSTSGSTSFIPVARLKPGEPNALRHYPSNRWWTLANTASCKVHVSVQED